MKTILLILLALAVNAGAQTQISRYPRITSLASNDLLLVTKSNVGNYTITADALRADVSTSAPLRSLLITTSNEIVSVVQTLTNGLASTSYVASATAGLSNSIWPLLSAKQDTNAALAALSANNGGSLTNLQSSQLTGQIPNAALTATRQTNGTLVEVASLSLTNGGRFAVGTAVIASTNNVLMLTNTGTTTPIGGNVSNVVLQLGALANGVPARVVWGARGSGNGAWFDSETFNGIFGGFTATFGNGSVAWVVNSGGQPYSIDWRGSTGNIVLQARTNAFVNITNASLRISSFLGLVPRSGGPVWGEHLVTNHPFVWASNSSPPTIFASYFAADSNRQDKVLLSFP